MKVHLFISMQGKIVDQEVKTNLKKPETPTTIDKVAKVSAFGPAQQGTYQQEAFRNLREYKPRQTRKVVEYTGWERTGTVSTPSAPAVTSGVSYFDIEDGSVYFEVVGDNTYYEVVY